MKVKATVIVNLDKMEVFSMEFNDASLNTANTTPGRVRLYKFIKKRILQTPIKDFKPHTNLLSRGTAFVSTQIELDVYPYVWKARYALSSKEFPYKCELFPYPVTNRSDISFDDYQRLRLEEGTKKVNERESLK